MKIEIHLYASLTKYLIDPMVKDDQVIELEEGTSIQKLLLQLEIPMTEVKLVFVNGVHADRETVLKHNDRLGLFPPVGGG